MPPFDGPRAMLWVTLYPSKTCVVPSSIATGIETPTAFLHFSRTLTRFGSIANVFATLCSCAFAMSYGFSRRCESGASTVLTYGSFFRANGGLSVAAGRTLLDREGDRAPSWRSSHFPDGSTDPATKVRSAGVASDGRKRRSERCTDDSTGRVCGPKVIAHGTRASRPASGVMTRAPLAGAVPSSALVTRARTRT